MPAWHPLLINFRNGNVAKAREGRQVQKQAGQGVPLWTFINFHNDNVAKAWEGRLVQKQASQGVPVSAQPAISTAD